MSNILDDINSPTDVKKLNYNELNLLAKEIRKFLIKSISKTGGHLASNLGVVELTLALHNVFSTPHDKIIWDVGHQTYVHKIITGRKNRFSTLRQLNGLSGFPKSNESEHDIFNTGHSSTSISAALGIAKARDLKNENYSVIAIIGDGALTGGMAFEALNDAGRSPNNLIVILNDNGMSIAKNVGGLSTYLSRIRTQPAYFRVKQNINAFLDKLPLVGKRLQKTVSKAKGTIKYLVMPGILFEELGFTYLGPIDGHNISDLITVLNRAKRMSGPIFIHICTVKGKGYTYAENNPDTFHGISSFNIKTGKVDKKRDTLSYSEVFGKCMLDMAINDTSIVAVTAAMPDGTGLRGFAQKFSDRFFDVGIAEQHAVTFAAGLAVSGLKPVFAVYSSFLQRAYDQVLHDVAMQNLHVVFAVDRSGLVGQDGETHQGIFDLSYLSHIPNMTVMAPSCLRELELMLKYAVLKHKGPIALRYPRGVEDYQVPIQNFEILPGKADIVKEGKDISIIAIGKMVGIGLHAADKLKFNNIDAEVINVRSLKPLDESSIINSILKTGKVISLEDNTIIGGLGSSILSLLNKKGINNINIKIKGYNDKFIPQGLTNNLLKKYRLDSESIVNDILQMMKI